MNTNSNILKEKIVIKKEIKDNIVSITITINNNEEIIIKTINPVDNSLENNVSCEVSTIPLTHVSNSFSARCYKLFKLLCRNRRREKRPVQIQINIYK